MTKPRRSILPLLLILAGTAAAGPIDVRSPDGKTRLSVAIDDRGRPGFAVSVRDIPVASGSLGLEFAGAPPLVEGLKVVGSRRASRDETYAIPVGKASSARDRHEELVVSLGAADGRRLDVAFRAFDDGVAFRYEIPAGAEPTPFALTAERTRLAFPDDPQARYLPLGGFTTSYEAYYRTGPVSAIAPATLIGMPILLGGGERGEGRPWLAVTEANLLDYAGMYLAPVADRPGTFESRLSPLPGRSDGALVIGDGAFSSPWRVLLIADEPGRLIESNLIFHLSEPSRVADTSWIRPGKTTFPWWNGYALDGVDFTPGVNTETMLYYIDFCAEQGIPYHSLDGLDIAWYGGPIRPEGPTDVTTAAPSIDLPAVLRRAKEKGVRLRLWMHWEALKPRIDEAFAAYESWGIEGVMVDFMDRDDQEMVRFYREMAEKAAKHHLTLTLHGAYKPTGLERTYPNVLTYEAVLNQEYNKWQPPGVKGTPPSHNLDVAAVRTIAGPLDYHQAGMRSVLPESYRFRDKAPPVQGTRGQQLAMFVVYQNHMPMLADSPTAYRGAAGFDFLVSVPTNWDETRVLREEPGEFIVVARRRGDSWYLGGMAAERPHDLDIPLDFLGDGPHRLVLHSDRPADGPNALDRREQSVRSTDHLRVAIPRAGGFAASLSRDPR